MTFYAETEESEDPIKLAAKDKKEAIAEAFRRLKKVIVVYSDDGEGNLTIDWEWGDGIGR